MLFFIVYILICHFATAKVVDDNLCPTAKTMTAFINTFAFGITGSWLLLLSLQNLTCHTPKTLQQVETARLKSEKFKIYIRGFYFLVGVPVWFYASMGIWREFDGYLCMSGEGIL